MSAHRIFYRSFFFLRKSRFFRKCIQYFPGDPLLSFDPIYNSVPEGARARLQAAFDMEATQPEWALAYRFDIVLRGRNATPMEIP